MLIPHFSCSDYCLLIPHPSSLIPHSLLVRRDVAQVQQAVAGLHEQAVGTTGDHLARTLSAGYWPVAGVDLMLLASAGVAGLAARKLSRSVDVRELSPTAEPEHA